VSIAVAKANLADALKQLRTRWDRAKDQWDDAAAAQFYKEFIEPLEARVVAAVKALDHVAELTAVVRRECGDDSG
jgi:hypothetical protein